MSEPVQTCWTLILGAARGVEGDVDVFVALYGPVARSYFEARWPASPNAQRVDDAVQDVFVECFKHGGVLARAAPDKLQSFRAFLLGVARNIGRRFETAAGGSREIQPDTLFDPEEDAADAHLSRVFDRAWARAIMREAGERQRERAAIGGPDAVRRVELLSLHFGEGLPVREIARRWDAELKPLHRELEKARAEFQEALRDVMRVHDPHCVDSVEKEMARLMDLLAA